LLVSAESPNDVFRGGCFCGAFGAQGKLIAWDYYDLRKTLAHTFQNRIGVKAIGARIAKSVECYEVHVYIQAEALSPHGSE
jgi:hypothetical protein